MRSFIQSHYGVLLATIVGVAATTSLGVWQLDRAAQKRALQRALDEQAALAPLAPVELAATASAARAQHYRRVRLSGQWLDRYTVFLDNRQVEGHPGFLVVTPLRVTGSATTVLVQRGWAPRNLADRTALPTVATPAGEVVVEGHIAPPPARLFDFAASEAGRIRQNIDLTAYAAETGLPLAPLSVVQDRGPDDGLVRHWPRPSLDINRNYGYAFQWFAMAALMTGLYVWFQLVRPRLARRA
jgi:surfeit locus 1 family protein